MSLKIKDCRYKKGRFEKFYGSGKHPFRLIAETTQMGYAAMIVNNIFVGMMAMCAGQALPLAGIV